MILHDDERALHVLLDGPVEGGCAAMEIEGVDRQTAEHRRKRIDRFRRSYIETSTGSTCARPASATSS